MSSAEASAEYEATINRSFATISKSLTTLTIGEYLDIASRHFPERAAQLGLPPEFFTNTYRFGNDKTNRLVYDWRTWRALDAAQDDRTWVGSSHPVGSVSR